MMERPYDPVAKAYELLAPIVEGTADDAGALIAIEEAVGFLGEALGDPGSEAECDPLWFAETRWAAEDVISAAKEQGISLTEAQAENWLRRNERRFADMLVEYGNEILADMDFAEEGR